MANDIKISTVEDAEKLREEIVSVVEGWYPPGTSIDWEDLLGRVEGTDYDLGTDMSSQAIQHIQRVVRQTRRQLR